MGPGTRTLFSYQVGSRVDTDPVVQRSEGKTTGWRSADCEVGQRFLYLHQVFLVPPVAGRSSGSLSPIREPVVVRKVRARVANAAMRSWWKASGLALPLCAV